MCTRKINIKSPEQRKISEKLFYIWFCVYGSDVHAGAARNRRSKEYQITAAWKPAFQLIGSQLNAPAQNLLSQNTVITNLLQTTRAPGLRVPSTALELQAGSRSSTQEEILAQPHKWVLGVSVQDQRWDVRRKGLKLARSGHVNSLHLFPVFLCPEKSKNSKTRRYSKGSPLAGVSGFLPL